MLRWVVRGFGNVPLRAVLIVPFVLQVSVVVGLTSYLCWRNGQRALKDVANQVGNEVTARLHDHVVNYIELPQVITQLNANAIRLGEVSWEDPTQMERRLWNQMQMFQSLSLIAFGNQQGEVHAVDRLQNSSLVIRVIDESTGGRYHTYATNNRGDRTQLLQVSQTFDPTLRPWYRDAIAAGRPVWSEIYPYFSSSGLAISASRPLYDSQTNAIVGITNATLRLSEVGHFLQSLDISRSGQAFIIEQSGELVASSTTEPPFVVQQEGERRRYKRLSATASHDRTTRLATDYLLNHSNNLSNLDIRQQLEFEIDGERQFLHVVPLRDQYGLNWLIVVVIPETDFTEYIEANTRMMIWASTGALIAALIFGWLTSHWLAQPILRLSRASQAIAQGKLDQRLNKDLVIKELNVMAQSFNEMAVQLNRSFEYVIGELQKSEEKFAKIFLSSPDPITISDLEEGRYLEVNDSTLRVLDCSREEIIGRSSVELGLWADLEARDRFLQLFNEHNSIRSYEVAIRSRSGEIKTVLISAELIELDGSPCILTIAKDISDRKRTEEALRLSEVRFRTAVEQFPDVVVLYDAERRFQFVNTKGIQISGKSLEEHLGRRDEEIHPPDITDTYLPLLLRAVETKTMQAGECTITLPGRDSSTFIVKYLPLLDDQGRIQQILALTYDITYRKVAEKALRQREQEFRALVENAPDVISRVDRNYRFRYVNPRIEIETGIPAAEWIGKTESELGLPDSIVNPWHAALKHVFETGQEHIYESEFPSPKGKQYWVGRMAPEFAEDGSVETVLVIARNITERKQAEEALWESNHLLQSILDSAPFAIFVKNVQGQYIVLNPFAAINVGANYEEAIGKTDYELLPEEVANHLRDNDCLALELGTVVEREEVLYREDGPHTLITTKFPLYNQDGSLQGVGGIAIDVTERKRIESEREQAEEKIRASLEEKEILLKEIHHRVKNNLQVVVSLLSLQSRSIDDERTQEIFKESQNRVRVMALTHEKLYQSPSLARIDFASYVRNLVEEVMFSYSINPATIQLNIQIEAIDLNIDTAIPCGLIINELISNALKYAFPTQRGEICIECCAIAEEQYELIVSDNGVGLPETFDSSKASSLGLRLVQSLTRQLKGKMEIERTNGTRFKIIFSAL